MKYRRTLIACYLGFITQAITANFAPLLFLRFQAEFSIPLGKVAVIPALFFLTQLTVDALCARHAEKIDYRRCVVASEALAAAGLMGLAFLPQLTGDPFIGILISVVIYAVGSGLIEVLVSPIVEACPFEHKDAVMSTLHSFYCWGCVGVVGFSTAFFAVFGMQNWRVLACLWALLPFVNLFNFRVCPIERLTEEGKGMTVRSLIKNKVFRISVVLMVCAGACELAMSQWASAYAEEALGLTKIWGDLLGPCLFAVAMGGSRVLYGRGSSRGKMNLMPYMMVSGLLCLICYLLAAFAQMPMLGLLGCAVCGFSVGIMWPGTISLCSARLPAGGTAMFALLAMAGDLGGAMAPGLVGLIAQSAGDSLQAGMAAGCVFPIVLMAALLKLRKQR